MPISDQRRLMFTDPVMDQWHFSIGNSAHLSLTIDLANCDRGQSTRLCFQQEKKCITFQFHRRQMLDLFAFLMPDFNWEKMRVIVKATGSWKQVLGADEAGLQSTSSKNDQQPHFTTVIRSHQKYFSWVFVELQRSQNHATAWLL